MVVNLLTPITTLCMVIFRNYDQNLNYKQRIAVRIILVSVSSICQYKSFKRKLLDIKTHYIQL